MYEQGRQEQSQHPRGSSQSRPERNGSNPGSGGGSDRSGRDRIEAAGDHSLRVAELAIRGTTTLMEIQFGALRSLWQMQARAASAFGMPDSTDLLRIADDGFHRVWTSGAEQLLASTRRANQAFGEMQRQYGQILEEGTSELSEQMRSGIEDLSRRTQANLDELQQMARQSAREGRQMLREGERIAQGAQAGEERSAGQWPDARRTQAQESPAGEGETASSGAQGGDEQPFLTSRERAEEAAPAGREAQGSRQTAERNGSRGGKRH